MTSVPARCPARRMHDHARGLVDHDDVGIVVEHGQRQRFGGRSRRRRRRNADGDGEARPDGQRSASPTPSDSCTWPSRISRCTCDRDSPGSRWARNMIEARALVRRRRQSRRAGDASSAVISFRARRAVDRRSSMTRASGTSSSETNCDVDTPRIVPRVVAAEDLDDEARDRRRAACRARTSGPRTGGLAAR